MTPDDKSAPPPVELTQRKQSQAAFGYRAGEVIEGKYELVKLLERGRVTAIWAVQDLVLDAQFALKMLANDGSNPQAVEHMLRQARAAAAIDHPAVTKVFDFGVTLRGDPFIVMELLRGETIEQMLRVHRAIPPIEAVRLLLPIAEALELAHKHGAMHRNIKPENIVCTRGESGRVQPKLVDFGIAGSIEHGSALTAQPGATVGPPDYLSPEQISDEARVDQRSDVWSFSVVLYEMLTGISPFHRDTSPMTLGAILAEPAQPLAPAGVTDGELSGIILRGLEKSPDARWGDMRAYGAALAGWLVRQGAEDDATGQGVRAVWLGGGGSASAPPVALVNPHFPGAEDAYEVPKNRVWRTVAGIAGSGVALAAIFAAGAARMGAFGRGAPAAATSDDPWVTADERPEEPVHRLEFPAGDLALPGSKDAGAEADADAQDAALDALDAERPSARLPKPRFRWSAGVTAAPAWRKPADRSTLLPIPQPPPDLGPSEPPEEEDGVVTDQPYGD